MIPTAGEALLIGAMVMVIMFSPLIVWVAWEMAQHYDEEDNKKLRR